MSLTYPPYDRELVDGIWNLTPGGLVLALRTAFPDNAAKLRCFGSQVTIILEDDGGGDTPAEGAVDTVVADTKAAFDSLVALKETRRLAVDEHTVALILALSDLQTGVDLKAQIDAAASVAEVNAIVDGRTADGESPIIFPGPPTSSVVMDMAVLKLVDLNPILANTNLPGSSTEIKVGPQGVMKISGGPDNYLMIVEGIEDTDAGIDDRTLAHRALASNIQGPWAINPATAVNDGLEGWENDEAAPSMVVLSADGTQIEVGYHGGNNAGPRQIGVMRSSSLDALSFTKDPGNPLISAGTSGAWDDAWVADVKGMRLDDGTLVLLYKGNDGTTNRIGLMTGLDWDSLTKYEGNPVVSLGGASSWNEGSVHGGDFVIDARGRLHLWTPGETSGGGTGIGYFYSDDIGKGWTEGANNPIASPTGVAGDPDRDAIGDVLTAVPHGDTVVLFFAQSNLTDYPGGDLRGLGLAIVPFQSDDPVKPARWYYPGSTRPYTDLGGAGIMNRTDFAICTRFRAFRINRTRYRSIYTEAIAFNFLSFLRIEGNSPDAGKLKVYLRLDDEEINLISTSTYDDSEWHEVAVVRTSTPSNELQLWIDGVQDTEAAMSGDVNAGTATTAVGNWGGTSGEPDEPFEGTISDLVIVDTALTGAEASAVLATRTYPGGASKVVDAIPDGTDSGPVYVVDATEAVPVSLT